MPAGMIERGEPPIETAHRELIEETGYRAESLRFLWSIYTTPGFCEERIHFFAGRGPDRREAAEPEDGRRVRVANLADRGGVEARGERSNCAMRRRKIALAWARSQNE